MTRRLAVLAAIVAALALPASASAADTLEPKIKHDLEFASAQLKRTLQEVPTGSYPHYTQSNGTWLLRPSGWWISGFLPGSLWLMYEATKDTFWRNAAAARQADLESHKSNTGTHDLGFMIFDSFGNGHRLTGTDAWRQVVLTAASSLSTRYSSIVRAIRSHNNSSGDAATDFKVIVDGMMNLELLTWAARNGGSSTLRTQALEHALRTAAEHVRPDGSTYQRVIFDSSTGAVKRKDTQQGFSTDSTWARGQAWAIHGFTMAYRELGDARMLAVARRVADWWVSHLPADKVPYWDFNAPGIPNEPRDSSAAAIAASGLIDLAMRERDSVRFKRYLDAARATLASLSSPSYLAEGTSARSILLHGTSHKPAGEFDMGLIYGDYFFLESLIRYRKLVAKLPRRVGSRPPTGSFGASRAR